MRFKNCSFAVTKGSIHGEHSAGWVTFPRKSLGVSPDVYFSYCCAEEQMLSGTAIENIIILLQRKSDIYNNNKNEIFEM